MSVLHDRLDEALVREVLNVALDAGADFAELYAEQRRGRSVRIEDQRVEELSSGADLGAGVRVMNDGRTGYAYTNVLERDSLVAAARTAAAGSHGEPRRSTLDLTRPGRRVEHTVKIDPLEIDKQGLVDLAAAADDAAREAGDEVRQVMVGYLDTRTDVLIVNSDGRLIDDDRTRTRLSVRVVAARGDVLQTGSESIGASAGHEIFDGDPPARIGAEAARQAIAMLSSEPAPSGEMPVVLWRGDGGVLFHEAIGHGMEGDIVAKEASVYAGRRGERIGSDLVTGVDDATLLNGWGSFAFDDEGTPAQRTVLIEEGVVGDYLTDRRSAHRLGAGTTGNGRRQSYRHLPIPRMTNTYIVPGEADPDALVAELDHGVLCKGLGGGQVDPATGDFVFGMTEAYLVEGGEIRHALRGANLVGNGPETLARIDAVGSDFATRPGICGKEGQSAPAALGAPTLRIARITIGGTA